MMHKVLRQAHELNIEQNAFSGAGSIAAALFTREQIKFYMGRPDEDHPATRAFRYAYFGGRFDTASIGEHPIAHQYDINSAYPSQVRNLPCLACAEWKRVKDFDPSLIGVWDVEWNNAHDYELDYRFPPFPLRMKDGRICYPTRGAGWYHTSEVAAALTYDSYKCHIKVFRGWVIDPDSRCDHKPFDFVNDLYKQRQQLKQAGNFGEKILKLGMNAMYGKLAQAIGFTNPLTDEISVPPYQSFFWAGMVTAGCRAQISTVLAKHDQNIISVATDGIVSKVLIPELKISKELGDWEYTSTNELFVAQSGMYEYMNEEHNPVVRTRGIGRREVDFQKMRDAFRKFYEAGAPSEDVDNLKFQTSSRRFIRLGTALKKTDGLATWRTWQAVIKSITFVPKLKAKRLVDDRIELLPYEPPAVEADFEDEDQRSHTPEILRSCIYRPKSSWKEYRRLKDRDGIGE